MATNPTKEICSIAGNADLYGLGVRLGLYLQFLAIIVSRPSATVAFRTLQTSTIAFILANLIVMIKESVQRTILAPEAYLLFFLLVPQLTVTVLTIDKKNTNYLRGTLVALMIQAFIGYFSWFWWTGLDQLPLSGCDDEYGWFFARVKLRGWFRTLNKAIWTSLVIVYGAVALGGVVTLLVVYCIQDPTPTPETKVVKEAQTESKSKNRILVSHISTAVRSILPFSVSVAGAEVTIRWNNIRGVNELSSASQLIPLVLGLGLLIYVLHGTLRTLYHGFKHALSEDGAENAEEAKHRQSLRAESGWNGKVFRFVYRILASFVLLCNQVPEKDELGGLASVPSCPGKSGQYYALKHGSGTLASSAV